MTRKYNRSEIISFCELNAAQQNTILDLYHNEVADAEQDSYVMLDENPLPLSMFMRTTNNNFTHGIYSTSVFDGYFITLAKSSDCAVVAHKYF